MPWLHLRQRTAKRIICSAVSAESEICCSVNSEYEVVSDRILSRVYSLLEKRAIRQFDRAVAQFTDVDGNKSAGK